MPSRAGTVAATVVAAVLAVAAAWLYFALRHAQEAQQQLAAEQAALKKDMRELRERAAAKAEQAAQKDKRIESLLAEQNALQDKLAKQDELEMQAQGLREQNAALAQQLAEVTAKERQTSAAHAKTLEDAKARSAELNRAYEGLLEEKSELAASSAAHQAELARIKAAFEQAQSEVARLTGARGIYTVQNGDSLSKIAAFFYHHASRWPDILRANSHLIDKPDLIYPKQVLIIPQ